MPKPALRLTNVEWVSDRYNLDSLPSGVFVIPVGEFYILYAPLHHLSALINYSALTAIRSHFSGGLTAIDEIKLLVTALSENVITPRPLTGGLGEPYFLGLLPTRGCNMACRYCDFLTGDSRVMDFNTTRHAVNAYIVHLKGRQCAVGALHFFGGEPFYAPQVVQFALEYARLKAFEATLSLHFESTTNGFYDEDLATWIGDNLNTVVLSLDGFADVQNHHRPGRNGLPSFERVTTSASIFAASPCELVLRTAVSQLNVESLPEIAAWFAESFSPAQVCFEPLSESAASRRHGLTPPEPLMYARKFNEAAEILRAYGIRTVLSSADLSENRVTACPLGRDALIVTPEGRINACYLLDEEWRRQGLNLELGRVTPSGFNLDSDALQHMRDFSVDNKSRCARCFCRFSCAGGCHVHHPGNLPAGQYDDLCLRTRLVTAAQLLDDLGRDDLRRAWLADEKAAWQTARCCDDRLFPLEQLR